ncbi:hypothetical protein IL252_16965 [Halomicrobium sp. IBSBa]|uniref:DUF7344 domain-containing protein n=1 Tax=Halomicrobium sp. IBSBa TaxID=2778916 RepID=UPI001ABF929A|nr:hypothetical protein [Halomicrobium sp. IBSBa]MBO4249500.1 hypothetical protein [Halomicrobium sp. IBSBa]
MTEHESLPTDASDDKPDHVLRLLASETRRAALRELRSEPSRSLDALADAVADSEGVSVESTERLCHRLHHCHLPRLETVGVCRYDPDESRVDYVGDETVEAVLSLLEE